MTQSSFMGIVEKEGWGWGGQGLLFQSGLAVSFSCRFLLEVLAVVELHQHFYMITLLLT